MKHNIHTHESGAVNGWVVTAIAFIFLFLAAAGLAVWALMEYGGLKSTFDNQVNLKSAEAAKKQSDEDEKKFAEREKQPYTQFASPDEFGRVTFHYPKTWSVYEDDTGKNGRSDYKAYLNPGVVPPVNGNNRYAVRVEVLNQNIDQITKQYQALVEKGTLKVTNKEVNGNAALQYEGAFTDKLRGLVTLMKVRDKTIRISTDAESFKPDYDEIIKTVQFNT